jgi:hypothetical protein
MGQRTSQPELIVSSARLRQLSCVVSGSRPNRDEIGSGFGVVYQQVLHVMCHGWVGRAFDDGISMVCTRSKLYPADTI